MAESFPLHDSSTTPGTARDLQPTPSALPLAASRPGLAEIQAEISALPPLQARPFPIEEIQFGPDRMILGLDSYKLGSPIRRRLCQGLRIPGDYFERLDPEMRGRLLSHHFQRKDYKSARLRNDNTQVIVRGGEAIALIRDELLTLPARDVLEAVQHGIGTAARSAQVKRFDWEDEGFTMELLSEQVATEVRPGDMILGGLRLRHSVIGDFATSIEAYAERLVCSNGLTRIECVRRRTARSIPRTRRLERTHRRAYELQCEQIRRMVADTWNALNPKLEAVRNLSDRPFEWEQLETFLGQARLPTTLRSRLQEAWETEGRETTAFGALNALTRLATHDPTLTSRQRIQVERLAGMFASHNTRICAHCMSVLH